LKWGSFEGVSNEFPLPKTRKKRRLSERQCVGRGEREREVLCGIKTIWRLTLEAAAAKPGGMSERGRGKREREEKGRAHLELKSLASETPEGCSSGVEVLSLPEFSSVVRLIWMRSGVHPFTGMVNRERCSWGVRYFTPYREVWGTVRSYCTGITWSITVDGK
jgi:hypothetical protein